MKAGELARALGVSSETIRNWTKNPLMRDLLSPESQGIGVPQRIFSETDVHILNTVNRLRSVEGVSSWQEIYDRIEAGERFSEFPQNAIADDPRTIPIPIAEESAKAAATLAQLKEYQLQVVALNDIITNMKIEHKEELDRRDDEIRGLNQRIADLNREMGKLEGQLEMFKVRKPKAPSEPENNNSSDWEYKF